MASEPAGISEPIRFGEDLELDAHSYQLRRSGRLLKLERIPLVLLLLLVEQRGQLVTREQIIERVWGRENDSTNFSKIRQRSQEKRRASLRTKAVAGGPTMFSYGWGVTMKTCSEKSAA